MKVYNLSCTSGHGFEGWFASEADFELQQNRGLVGCPICGDQAVVRRPSAPRLNLSSAPSTDAAPPARAEAKESPSGMVTAFTPEQQAVHALWMKAVKHVIANTEDVGSRFAAEARRIHHGEAEERGIRGKATEAERQALQEEGIEVASMPMPVDFNGTTH